MRDFDRISCGTVAIVSALVLTMNAHAADPKKAPSDKELIKSAMSAAPAKVAQGATIVVMEADGKMRTLRKGTNGFTCMPDNPATPGPDPMCFDKNAADWVMAWVEQKTPPAGKIGFMYMLAGGTDASNTDPYASQARAQQQLDQDRAAHHDRRCRSQLLRSVSQEPETRHVGALRDVGRHAVSAFDGAGEISTGLQKFRR